MNAGSSAARPLPESAPLLRVSHLRTEIRTDAGLIRPTDDVSFHIGRGETLGVVGESGCGKSVTALSIMRLIPNPPGRIVGGTVELDGRDLVSLPESEMRKVRGDRIGMIFQEPMTSLNPVFTAGAQVAESFRLHRGANRREARARAIEMLRQVGIPAPEERVDHYPHQMSGGMRQRVMIAMALACDPELLIADEPTTALDVTIQAQILDLIGRLRDERRMSVLLITHDLGVVAETCERVVVMYAGRVVEQADAKEIFRAPRHPYTVGLLRSVPTFEGERTRLRAIPGLVPPLHSLPKGCRFRDRCDRALDRCAVEDPPLVTMGMADVGRGLVPRHDPSAAPPAGDKPPPYNAHAVACWNPAT